MDGFLNDLYARRGPVREAALAAIVTGLTNNCRHEFAEKNFATLLYRCLNSFKKGSSKEIALASRALGMLAITVGSGDHGHELYKESLPLISKALKSKTESLLLSMIDYLAIATFVGANGFEETDASMQMIWQFIHSSPGEKVAVKKHSAFVVSAAVSAWSLLLTTVDGWNVKDNYWEGATSYFLNLLEEEDQSICRTAVEALALICEMGLLEKCGSNNTTVDEISLNEKGKNMSSQISSLQELKEIVSNHAKRLLKQTALQSAATKSVNGWNKFSLSILEVLEVGSFNEIALTVGKHSLELDSLIQLLQVNFIKRFLGRGFVLHMVENQFLHDVFNFTPGKQMSGDELYMSEREEVSVHTFVPELQQTCSDEDTQRTRRTTGSALRKGKTLLLNKQRDVKGEQLRLYDD